MSGDGRKREKGKERESDVEQSGKKALRLCLKII
jgi:hypothetical protein